MFWNKKKEEHKEEKEINFMFCRLMNMKVKLQEITKNFYYHTDEFSAFISTFGYSIYVNTALGKRRFNLELSDDVPYAITNYTLEMTKEDESSYGRYYASLIGGKHYEVIFKVSAFEDCMEVIPQMKKDGLTAHAIDLAVYELEQMVDKYFKLSKEQQAFHEDEVEKLMKRGN